MNGRLRPWTAVIVLAVVCYGPLLLTHRGEVGADTKSYLYLDPDRLLSRAWSMWDPNVGLGTVPHQNIGYLWPMGPFYWMFQHLGVPDWMAQRLWLGSILFLAGLGVRYLMRTLGQSGPGVAAAMFLYALSPYVLTLGARISALLLPFTALGWLLALAIRSTRERSWVHPAWFALAVPTFGSTNATALLLVGLAPALWLPYATFVLREIRFRQAAAVAARIGALTVGASLWWIVGLWCQGAFGIDVLRYTETARTVADASSAPELLRGIGYWYFYGNDKLGAWIEPSIAYTQNPGLITLTYGIPILGLLAAAVVRWRYRAFFVTLIVGGLVIAIGAHPWGEGAPIAAGFEVFLRSQAGLAMRSLPRAVPLISLSFAVLTGVAVNALGQRLPRLERPVGFALAALAVVCLPPLWRGQMVANNLQRDEQLPAYWTEAAAAIDERGRGSGGIYDSRVLEVPGSDFASYRWGNTVDPITPGITDRPYVARELIPYGTPASADLLNSLDRQMQEDVLDPAALAPLARLMGVGDIIQRSDLAYERFNLARPRQVYALLSDAPGIGDVTGFGGDAPQVPDPLLPLEDEVELGADPSLPDPPQVALFPVEGDSSIVSAKPLGTTVLVAGNGDGLLAAAAAGLIDGTELVRYSGSAFAVGGSGDVELRAALAEGGAIVVTDSNRRSGRRWGTVRETDGATETVDQGPSADDPSDNRLPVFEGAGTDSETVAVWRGGVSVWATSYGNAITYTPEDRPAGALDDDPETAWYTGAFADATGERIEVSYDEPRTTDRVRLTQAARGVQNRWITGVRLRFDGGPPVDVELGPESRQVQGQWIDVGSRTFSELSIEVRATDVGSRDSYADVSAIGFSDIRLGSDDLRLQESIRPPTDLLDALGEASDDVPLALSFTRLRARATAALRSDPEQAMARDIDLPTARSFALTGTARLSDIATDEMLDQLLGLPAVADGGIETDASRHLPGDLSGRPTNAIDDDPSTHWSPGFLGQDAEWASYTQTEPVTFDHMDLQVVADGRHTVPTRLRIVADGVTAATVDVPEIADRPEKDAVVSVPLDLPASVTGRRIEIHIDASRPVETNDWISTAPVIMPVGIAEWGIPGITEDIPTGDFDSGCRDDLVTVDGSPVSVQVTGDVEAAVSGQALDVALCGPSEDGIDLPAGASQLRTARGRDTGLQIDAVTLRSAAGGSASFEEGTLIDGGERPEAVDVDVTRADRWRRTIEVGPRTQSTWLVVGQSHNEGWRASMDGEDLGEPVLVDGYSAAFLIPAGDDPVTIEVEWAPQKVVLGGFGVSVLAVLACLALALRPWRWRRRAEAPDALAAPDDPDDPAPPLDEAPQPLSLAPLLRSPGTAPGWLASVALAVGAGVVGVAAVNPVAGVVLAGLALLVVRVARARPLLVLAPSALLALSGAYIVVQQVRHHLPAGFEWPSRFGRVHGVAYVGVLLLGLGILVDRLRTGSWTDEVATGDPSPDQVVDQTTHPGDGGT